MSAQSKAEAFVAGTTIAHYRILEPLGQGGMGAVYKALDEKLNREVALKVLPAEYVTHEDRRRRFLQEARAASRLNHPHILTVYEIGEADGIPFMATEYIEGETLRQRINGQPLPAKEALDIALQIAEGLRKAHEHGILHPEAPPPHAIKPDVPRALHALLAKALAKAPKERYQTIKEFAAALKQLKRDLEAGRAIAPVTKKLVLKPSTAAQRAPKIDYERELNEAQYQAVTTIDGPLLIVAGAGTGKTRTLVYRVARLVETGIRPESRLLLTFTRRTASSMLSRAAALADERCQTGSGGTFHSMAHAILRRHAEAAGALRSLTVRYTCDAREGI